MRVTLWNSENPEYGETTIPFPIPDEEYDRCMEQLERMQIGDVTGHDCHVAQIMDAPPALDMLEGTLVNVDELDFLARSLERFTDEELAKFQCMTTTRDSWDMETLINLSFCCEQTTVITNFADLERVGKNHYMTIHGGSCPTEEYNQLNGIGIARMLIAEGQGKVTPYGVLFENSMRLEPFYSGLSFPDYADQHYPVELELKSDLEGAVPLFLPQPEKRLERLLERAGIRNPQQVDIQTWYIEWPDALLACLDIAHEDIFALNKLSAAVNGLDEKQMSKLSAAVTLAKPEYAFQVCQLVKNLELFDFIPGVRSAEEYGRYMIRDSGHYEYDENLDAYYDYAAYGQQRMNREYGEFTSEGYVSYHGTMSLDELMMESPKGQASAMQMGGMA